MSRFNCFPLVRILPGLAIGLYFGRILSELWAGWAGETSLPIAFGLTAASTFLSLWWTKSQPLTKSWPALLLFFYATYPEGNIKVASMTFALALIAWLQVLKPWQKWPLGKRSSVYFGLLVTLAFFALYFLTLAPDILPADNGEFQLIATELGIAHPPGFPLYTIVAHGLTLLPFGPSPAYRVNFFSAVTSALTLAAVYAGVYLLTKKHSGAITAVIALGTATTFWAQATTANIRSLTGLFAALMMLSLIAFYQAIKMPGKSQTNYQRDRYLILFSLILSLGIAHHPSLVFLGVISILFIVLVEPALIRSPRRWGRPLLAFLLGLLPLLYFPIRANAEVRGASPALATVSGFLEHTLALGFRGDLFAYLDPNLLWERLIIMANVLTFQFEVWLLVMMLLGFILLLFEEWRIALLFGGSFLLFTLITATYRAPQTVEYMVPAYIPLALLLGYAAAGKWFSAGQKAQGRIRRITGAVLLAITLVIAGRQLFRNLPNYRELHSVLDARDYAQPILLKAPRNSIILADWHWVTPLWYLQEIENLREDVEIKFVFPEGEPYADTWARRIREELDQSRSVISTHFDPQSYASLPLPEPLHEAYLFPLAPRLKLPDNSIPVDKNLGGQIKILGYELSTPQVEIGDPLLLYLAWEPMTSLPEGTTLFIHLAGPDGQLYGQQDQQARPQPTGITLTQFEITPRLGALPGDYQIFVGAYGDEPLGDRDGETPKILATIQITTMTQPPATQHELARQMIGPDYQELVGYDWDNTLPGPPRLYLHWKTEGGFQTEVQDGSPREFQPYAGPWGLRTQNWSAVSNPGSGNYVPFGRGIIWRGKTLNPNKELSGGEAIILPQHFLSSRPVMRDYAVSVRLIGYEEDGYHWMWWDLNDSIPAMGSIPTLKWVAGSSIRSPHFLSVHEKAAAGQEVGGALTLYNAFTGQPLPILDERINANYAWVPLGKTIVEEN